MEKHFHFVDGIHADKASKKLMRRHVMKGKNAGKKFHRPSKLGLQAAQHPGNIDRTPIPTHIDGDLVFSLPIQVSRVSMNIVNEFFALTTDKLYPTQLGISSYDAKRMWLEGLFADEATYLCNVALMQACNGIFISGGGSPPRVLYHLSQTFDLVQNRLKSTNAISDSTIAIVLSLIQQEQIRQHHAAAAVHMQGLRRMVELRGGLEQLEGNNALVLKICKTDIMFALQNGEETMFFRDHMSDVRTFLSSRGFCYDSSSSASLVRPDGLDLDLCQPLLDAMTFGSLFNNYPNDCPLDLRTFQEIILSVCCRLLRYCPLNHNGKLSDIQAVYTDKHRGILLTNFLKHIGLMIFVMTTFIQHDHRRIIDTSLISSCLRNVLDRPLHEQRNDLILWLAIVGGIWVSSDDDGEFLATKLRTVALRVGITTWEEARSLISNYPWINVLHDQPGCTLWNRSQEEFQNHHGYVNAV